jgi:hypothetical protein
MKYFVAVISLLCGIESVSAWDQAFLSKAASAMRAVINPLATCQFDVYGRPGCYYRKTNVAGNHSVSLGVGEGDSVDGSFESWPADEAELAEMKDIVGKYFEKLGFEKFSIDNCIATGKLRVGAMEAQCSKLSSPGIAFLIVLAPNRTF